MVAAYTTANRVRMAIGQRNAQLISDFTPIWIFRRTVRPAGGISPFVSRRLRAGVADTKADPKYEDTIKRMCRMWAQ